MRSFIRRYWMLWVALVAVLLLRLPSVWEPFWYDDEAITVVVGQELGRGSILYGEVHDNKPPFLYWVSAATGNLEGLKIWLLGWMLLTTVGFYGLCRSVVGLYEAERTKELTKSRMDGEQMSALEKQRNVSIHVYRELNWQQWAVGLSLGVFVLFSSIPKWEGNIANGEIFMIGLSIWSMWLLLSHGWWSGYRWLQYWLVGVGLGCASMFKIPVSVDMLVVGWFVLFTVGRLRVWKDIWVQLLMLAVGFAMVQIGIGVWFVMRGVGWDYLNAVWFQNFGYLSSWTNDTRVVESSFSNNTGLRWRALYVLILTVALGAARKRINPALMLVGLWWAYGLFGVTLSERPYPHYMLQVLPALALGIGMIVWLRKVLEQMIVVLLLVCTIVVVHTTDFWEYVSRPYYRNFLEYMTGQRDYEMYINWFDGNMSDLYETHAWLVDHGFEGQPIYVWSNKAALYALGDHPVLTRYIVSYHVDDFVGYEDSAAMLMEEKPEIIVYVGESGYAFPELEAMVRDDYAAIFSRGIHTIYQRVDVETGVGSI